MKTSNGVTSVGSLPSTNRRQPVRQTRTNSLRTSVAASGALGDRASNQGGLGTGQNANSAPGFFPAITHFTDSISALPKEIIRHFTLLKEVDAKVFGPEETLGQLVAAATNTPAPVRNTHTSTSTSGATETSNATAPGGNISVPVASTNITSGHENQAQAYGEGADLARRSLFYNLRAVVQEMLMTLDEKNHVLSTATEALNKQLARVDSSFPYIANEISEEARYGSLMHWAYADKSATRGNGTTAGERSRRDVAAANNLAAAAAAVHEGEAAISRSESRREAMLARKQRNVRADSDFDEGRQLHPSNPAGALRRPHGTGKVRKAVEAPGTSTVTALGLGITNGSGSTTNVSTVANKRRRIEKPAMSTGNSLPAMERSMSTVPQSNGGGGKGGAGSPRETPAADGSRKRARGGAAPSGPVRKRNNTNTSAAGPPAIISSPAVGTSTQSKEPHRSSPVPSASAPQRPPSSRARRNSVQSARPESHQRAQSSASYKQPITNGTSATTTDTNIISGSTGRSKPESHNLTKEEEIPTTDPPTEAKPEAAPRDSSKPHEKPLKREDPEPPNPTPRAHDRTTTQHTTTRKASKTSTPTTSTFPPTTGPSPATTTTAASAAKDEPHRPHRPSRNTTTDAPLPPIKRSHKKGAGAAAQQLMAAAAAAAAADHDEASSMQGDDEENEDEDDSEPRYCYCNQVSYGEMVACDMEACPREWFHLDCVGLARAPNRNAKWYCDECKENLRRGRTTGGSR